MRFVYRTGLWVGSLFTLTGCFNRLDTAAIEQEIEAEIESQSRRLSISEVRCPRNEYRQSGAYFRCVGQLRPEGQFTINVTQTDNQGSVEWDVPNSQVIINLAKTEAKLQEAFSQQFSKRAFIDCGELYRVNQPGEQFECQVIGGVTLEQDEVTALLVRVDPDGNLNWYEVREAIAPVAAAATAARTTGPAATPAAATSPTRGTAAAGGAPTRQPGSEANTTPPRQTGAGSSRDQFKPPRIAP